MCTKIHVHCMCTSLFHTHVLHTCVRVFVRMYCMCAYESWYMRCCICAWMHAYKNRMYQTCMRESLTSSVPQTARDFLQQHCNNTATSLQHHCNNTATTLQQHCKTATTQQHHCNITWLGIIILLSL
jgi:hypothetical protein